MIQQDITPKLISEADKNISKLLNPNKQHLHHFVLDFQDKNKFMVCDRCGESIKI